jgi:hypothetical protein
MWKKCLLLKYGDTKIYNQENLIPPKGQNKVPLSDLRKEGRKKTLNEKVRSMNCLKNNSK